MLKKAGIVVAAAAAGLLAVSPLAFAGESHGKDWGHGSSIASSEQNTEGLINVTDTNVNTPLQVCNNDVAALGGVQTKDVTTALTGALGLFGYADSDADITTDSSRGCAQPASTGDQTNAS